MDKKNKNKKLGMIISIIVILAVVIIGIVVYLVNSREKVIKEEFAITYEDGVKINTSKELAKDKQLDNLRITNIKLSYRNNTSTLLADVINDGSKIQDQQVKVEMLDKEGNVFMELKGIINSLEQGETTELNINVSADIAGAYNFRVSK